ncbi:MAG: hypothetical protein OXF02_04085 [Simkaniaceae bacterium]|nr:hypothetical protein [Simkaniaceae bacterium]
MSTRSGPAVTSLGLPRIPEAGPSVHPGEKSLAVTLATKNVVHGVLTGAGSDGAGCGGYPRERTIAAVVMVTGFCVGTPAFLTVSVLSAVYGGVPGAVLGPLFSGIPYLGVILGSCLYGCGVCKNKKSEGFPSPEEGMGVSHFPVAIPRQEYHGSRQGEEEAISESGAEPVGGSSSPEPEPVSIRERDEVCKSERSEESSSASAGGDVGASHPSAAMYGDEECRKSRQTEEEAVSESGAGPVGGSPLPGPECVLIREQGEVCKSEQSEESLPAEEGAGVWHSPTVVCDEEYHKPEQEEAVATSESGAESVDGSSLSDSECVLIYERNEVYESEKSEESPSVKEGVGVSIASLRGDV